MSPRAACRLTQLGFAPVYDYTLGKVDWLAAGLPTVRAGQLSRRVLDATRLDVPTCAADTPAGLALQEAQLRFGRPWHQSGATIPRPRATRGLSQFRRTVSF